MRLITAIFAMALFVIPAVNAEEYSVRNTTAFLGEIVGNGYIAHNFLLDYSDKTHMILRASPRYPEPDYAGICQASHDKLFPLDAIVRGNVCIDCKNPGTYCETKFTGE